MESRRPEPRTATLTGASPVARDTWVYQLTLDAALPFRAGQFVNLAVPDAKPRGERSYSVWSSPARPDVLELCIKLLEGGAASEYLRRAELGDALAIRGPFGVFTLKPEHEAVVFVATATGLAPFRSMLEVAVAERDTRPFRLYFGVRSQEDLFALEDLARYADALPDFAYRVCLSRPADGWTGFAGRVTDAIRADCVHAERPCHFYLCGNGPMIEEVRGFLKDEGFDRKQIHAEKYY